MSGDLVRKGGVKLPEELAGDIGYSGGPKSLAITVSITEPGKARKEDMATAEERQGGITGTLVSMVAISRWIMAGRLSQPIRRTRGAKNIELLHAKNGD